MASSKIGQLRRMDDLVIAVRGDDYAGASGHGCQEVAGLLEHLLQFTWGATEEVMHLAEVYNIKINRFGEVVDIEAVALLGGDATG